MTCTALPITTSTNHTKYVCTKTHDVSLCEAKQIHNKPRRTVWLDKYAFFQLELPNPLNNTRPGSPGKRPGRSPQEAWKEKIRNQAFSTIVPHLQNKLHLTPSLGTSKRFLKTWLFSPAFPDIAAPKHRAFFSSSTINSTILL